ncbi:MAG: hypothetical protein KatS3mg009_0745 [Acidimicrobiia bacterium]|nr:MAG: hypothetical protein KatS3mg009_0745 [Acidimicrobiia bacterium]
MMQPAMNAAVRAAPDAAKLRPPLPPVKPSGFATSVEVTKTITASGTRMTRIVRNCRLRYAQAPSWIADAISIIFGVPWSEASTLRIRAKPTRIASSAASPDSARTAHSPPFSTNSW